MSSNVKRSIGVSEKWSENLIYVWANSNSKFYMDIFGYWSKCLNHKISNRLWKVILSFQYIILKPNEIVPDNRNMAPVSFLLCPQCKLLNMWLLIKVASILVLGVVGIAIWYDPESGANSHLSQWFLKSFFMGRYNFCSYFQIEFNMFTWWFSTPVAWIKRWFLLDDISI